MADYVDRLRDNVLKAVAKLLIDRCDEIYSKHGFSVVSSDIVPWLSNSLMITLLIKTNTFHPTGDPYKYDHSYIMKRSKNNTILIRDRPLDHVFESPEICDPSFDPEKFINDSVRFIDKKPPFIHGKYTPPALDNEYPKAVARKE